MHYKKTFALAGVFLAVALITPLAAFYLQGISELDLYKRDYPTHQTEGNVTFIDQVQLSRQNTFLIVAAVETVFVLLFVVTIYYGINHMHPDHQRISLLRKDASD